MLKVMPESAIKFGSYEVSMPLARKVVMIQLTGKGSKRALAKLEGHNDAQQIHPWSKFLAGGIGGLISQ